MRRSILLTAGLVLGACSAASIEVPLDGPCAASKRHAPDHVYSRLALSMTTNETYVAGGVTIPDLTKDYRLQRKLELVQEKRDNWLPTINDGCLRAHAADWLGVHERSAREAIENRGRELREEAEERDQRRALAEKLGVRQ